MNPLRNEITFSTNPSVVAPEVANKLQQDVREIHSIIQSANLQRSCISVLATNINEPLTRIVLNKIYSILKKECELTLVQGNGDVEVEHKGVTKTFAIWHEEYIKPLLTEFDKIKDRFF